MHGVMLEVQLGVPSSSQSVANSIKTFGESWYKALFAGLSCASGPIERLGRSIRPGLTVKRECTQMHTDEKKPNRTITFTPGPGFSSVKDFSFGNGCKY
jgi:hypothetical protein